MSSWRQTIQANLTSALFTGGILLLLGFGLGYRLNPAIRTPNLRSLLSVMIGAQASILAIVVSVTLISTQLVATRYAPRMATLPFRTPLFKSAFILFAASIILDVFLLIGVAPASDPLYSGGLFVAGGLFFAVLVFLYSFVRGMVAHSSPENLVTLFTETISAEEYLIRSKALAESPEQNAHPLQPLYRFIMSALSKSEHGTARAALDQYQQYASRIMGELDEAGIFDDDSLNCSEELFGPVLKEHLHSITIHAAEKDESRILASAISAQVDLGKQGMALEKRTRVPGQALWGIRGTIIETPVTTDDYVTFNRAWPAVAELMLEETQYDQHTVLLSGRNLINGRLAGTLKRSSEPHWHTNALREFFEDLCEAHDTVLEHISDGPEFNEIDLEKDPSIHEMPAQNRVEQARFSKDAIIDATGTFLQFRIDEGFYPATEGNFRTLWEDLCISAASNGAEDHAVYLCQTLIEMAFIENVHRPYEQETGIPGLDEQQETDYLYWATQLARIRKETASPIVERAFDNILQYEYREGPTPVLFVGDDRGIKDEYYFTNLSLREYRSLNTHPQYPELVAELREQSL